MYSNISLVFDNLDIAGYSKKTLEQRLYRGDVAQSASDRDQKLRINKKKGFNYKKELQLKSGCFRILA